MISTAARKPGVNQAQSPVFQLDYVTLGIAWIPLVRFYYQQGFYLATDHQGWPSPYNYYGDQPNCSGSHYQFPLSSGRQYNPLAHTVSFHIGQIISYYQIGCNMEPSSESHNCCCHFRLSDATMSSIDAK
jgi:hypothetical protein